jgi:hypothetical protein
MHGSCLIKKFPDSSRLLSLNILSPQNHRSAVGRRSATRYQPELKRSEIGALGEIKQRESAQIAKGWGETSRLKTQCVMVRKLL